jgi:uncharacterized membrane protein YphA (DoxX/SURF4 family)
MSDSLSTPARQRLTALAVRWLLGALFLYMGLIKAQSPEDFMKLVRQYDLVQNPLLLNLIGACLPWFEAFCGLLLLAGLAVRGTALVLVAMLIPFTVLVWRHALLLHAAGSLPFCAISFDCGCGAGKVFICYKLVENAGLILLCGLLMCWCPAARKSADRSCGR